MVFVELAAALQAAQLELVLAVLVHADEGQSVVLLVLRAARRPMPCAYLVIPHLTSIISLIPRLPGFAIYLRKSVAKNLNKYLPVCTFKRGIPGAPADSLARCFVWLKSV